MILGEKGRTKKKKAPVAPLVDQGANKTKVMSSGPMELHILLKMHIWTALWVALDKSVIEAVYTDSILLITTIMIESHHQMDL